MGEAERPELADTVAGWSGGEGKAAILERGAAIGRYLVLELLGVGGMGAVYAAYDPELDRKVALKLVLPGAAGSLGRARILREAQAIARLSHPNVVTVHDVGTRVDEVFIAMELVDGVTLTSWLREAPRTTSAILEIFLQAGRGLAAAHKAGLVHRDFKPDNVLVGHDGRTRVVDFGLVREVERPEEEPNTPVPSERVLSMDLTQADSVMGTPAYMAPEVFMRLATDARSDQYSFCVSMFEALSGAVPYAADDLDSIAEKVTSGDIPVLGGERKVPPHVRAALRRGMHVTPAARFPSMEALLAELGRDRGAVRRRLLAGVAALAVVGGAIAVPLFARSPEAPEPCRGGEDRLAGAWDGSRRAAVERAFAATQAPYAADSARAVARSLDGYAGEWVKSWRDSCEATRVRGEQSAEMQDLRAGCLARHRSELEALVDLMIGADETTVRRAAAAAQLLPPAEECDDLEALKAPVPPPRGEAARREVEAIRQAAARIEALILAARYKDGLPQAEALLARARALGYQPLLAETGALVGMLHTRSGDPARGIASYQQAVASAIAGHHDEAVARVLILGVQTSADAEEFARAHEWAALAAAAVERIGNPPKRLAALHHVTGYLFSSEGKMHAAAAAHERALAIRQRISPTSLETSRSLNSLAYVYDEVGRYREARAMGERGLAIQRAELGPSHPDVAICLSNLGNIAADEGDQALAETYYRQALAIHEQAVGTGDDTSSLANALNNLGVAAFEQNRLDDALGFQRRALALREAVGPEEPEVAMSLNNIAAIEQKRGHSREALALSRKALAIAEKTLGADHPYVGDALSGIGEITLELGQEAESLAALERLLAIRQKSGARPIEMAEAQAGLARTLWEMGSRQRALELALTAQAVLAGTPAGRRDQAELDAWLRSRPAR